MTFPIQIKYKKCQKNRSWLWDDRKRHRQCNAFNWRQIKANFKKLFCVMIILLRCGQRSQSMIVLLRILLSFIDTALASFSCIVRLANQFYRKDFTNPKLLLFNTCFRSASQKNSELGFFNYIRVKKSCQLDYELGFLFLNMSYKVGFINSELGILQLY